MAELESTANDNGFATFTDMFSAYCIHELQSHRMKPITETANNQAKASLVALTGKFPAVKTIQVSPKTTQ